MGPAGIDRVLAGLGDRLASTLVIDTSKSGGTPEPRNGLLEVQQAFNVQGLDFTRHAVAVTMPGSRMDRLAHEEHWLAELRANPAALLALSWFHAGDGRGSRDMVVLPYKDSLLLFSRYLQQLVMESLGKERDLDGNIVHQGIAVYGNKGSTDQHAYIQQLRDGIPNFFATFIEVLEDRCGDSIEVEEGVTSGDFLSGFLLGTRQALSDNQRDSITIHRVEPRSVGALIALCERAVGLSASLVNINAYHQPGVEAGKKAAAAILDLQRRVVRVLQSAACPLSLEDLARLADAGSEVETVYQILRHLAAKSRGIALEGDPTRPGSLAVSLRQPALQP